MSKSKTVTLTTWEREFVRFHAEQLRGPVGLVRKCLQLLDLMELDKEEKEACGWRQTPGGVTWQEEQEYALTIKQPDLVPLVKQIVEQEIAHREKQEMWEAVSLRKIMTLAGKFDVDFDAAVTATQDKHPADEPQPEAEAA